MVSPGQLTCTYVNGEHGCFNPAIRPDSAEPGGQSAQQAGSTAVVPDAGEPDAGEPLSPQAADLVRRIARMLDEPAGLMA